MGNVQIPKRRRSVSIELMCDFDASRHCVRVCSDCLRVLLLYVLKQYLRPNRFAVATFSSLSLSSALCLALVLR